ncbi:O-antigen ligase family protein [Horticoccus luteus]|uniref:O-antigen ligase family protein n=1 Tax=Horticoccus luteus TaxID=2862869 RepID=A0A8F9XFV0_9BACT|nr:O-antigen ligase family protein [Horticoccus luteus]QYM77500.1 O-antigen ligase family protein [Horticoccus luteus]
MSAPAARLPRLVGQDETKLIRLHPLEKLLLAVVAAQLVFLPWAVGGMRLWAQFISLGLSAASLALALMPRHYTDEHTGGEAFTLYPLRRLLRFPLFWTGLVFAGYIVIGALNPGWRYEHDGGRWWMREIPRISWLPHGVTGTPFDWASPWRTLIIFGAAFLLVCALWVGITRRRSLQLLLLILCINAVLVALLAITMRATGATKLYWTWPSANLPYGPFVYRNHASAWLNLMIGATLALSALFHERAQRVMAKSSPAPLIAFVAVFLGVVVAVSQSRGGFIALLVFLAAALALAGVRQLRHRSTSRMLAIAALLGAGFIGFVALSFDSWGGAQAWQRFTRLFEDRDSSVTSRELATQATMDMWREAPWSGDGAASFRYVFPLYQQHYPDIYQHKSGRQTIRQVWEFAHNDWAQMLAEYGVIGTGIAIAAIAWWLLALLRLRAWRYAPSLLLVFAVGMTLLHARGDFVLHNPAVLLSFVAVAVVSLRLAEFAHASARRTRSA